MIERRLIRGMGPMPCSTLLVGEAGGADEHRMERPFVGKAGVVLTTFLSAAGVKREKVYIDNLYPYWTGPGNPDPTEEQMKEGGERLERTIREVQPKYVGCLGRWAARWFLGDGFVMKRDHGLVFEVEKGGRRMLVVPCVHPAAGFYDASAAAICQSDLAVLARLRETGGEGLWREFPMPRSKLVEFPGIHSANVVPQDGDAVDTEGSIANPWGMSWAGDHGSYVARTVKARPIIPRHVTFHYSLHDLKVLRTMGAETDELDYDDTIVMAFNLLGGGQDNSGESRANPFGLSLKVLAYRELGLRMKDFEDLVRPYYNAEVEGWVLDLLDKDLPKKSKSEPVQVKGEWKIYTPLPPARRFGAVLIDAVTGEKPPEKRWRDLPQWMQELGERRMGRKFPSISSSIALVPEEKAVEYAGADAWATRQLAMKYKARLREKGLEKAYEVDRKALPFVDEIVRNGLPLDLARTKRLRKKLEERTEEITSEIRRITGRRTFNPGSRDDVSWFLFREHGLAAPRLTEGGQESTDEKSVKIIRQRVGGGQEERKEERKEEVVRFLDLLLDYREADKYIGTYLDWVIEKAVGGKGERERERLYPDDISTTRVVSGRLSGRLLTFPTRTELGMEVRKCFQARPGWKILSVDLSQIELRMMAEMSQDPVMLAAFEDGQDLHELTARKLFRVEKEKAVKKMLRYIAKTLNFAILYGISPRALLEQLAVAGIYDYTLADCERFIKEWFSLYQGVREYLERIWMEARKTGEVRDWVGRVRYVPGIRLPMGTMLEKAQRDVGNFPIQAGARELVKIAEAEMMPWVRRVRDVALAILDIHDEVLFEVDEDVVGEVGETVRGYMVAEGRRRFGVKVEAGVSWGGSWGEAK